MRFVTYASPAGDDRVGVVVPDGAGAAVRAMGSALGRAVEKLNIAALGPKRPIADNAGLIATGRDSTFQNKVHLAMQAKGFFEKDDDGTA